MREEWKNQAVRRLELMRRVLLTLGQRLESLGRLSKTEDIFFLEPNELDPASAGAASREFRERIEQRRAEYVRNQAHRPPRVVKGRFSPQADIGQAVDGNTKVLKGISVSPGLVVGRARVILRSDDHEHVLPGEILVAPFTDPAWTPYFVTAAGVVMDQGGILSHGSIVAREYGLPAVTNAGCATQLVRTGDLIEVDGNAGTVTIVQPAHSRPPLT
ncbi:MAG: PEP-utilizing enzyme [Verrucomicrobiota bacterium]